jgi:tetratricopeptide (TPR) repeat protein
VNYLKRCAWFILIVTCVDSYCLPAQENRKHYSPDTQTLFYLLKNRLYAPLTNKVESYEKAFELDPTEEDNVMKVWNSFDVGNKEWEPFLNEWVNRFPNSYAPYVARAFYYIRVGWDIRGSRWASETSSQQFSSLEKYLRLASDDLAQALKINSHLVVCFEKIITIAMHFSDADMKRKALDEALKICPGCLSVRVAYMWSIFPRWGGSYEEMEAFADEAKQYVQYNSQLRLLKGYIPFDKGSLYALQGDYEQAIKLYDQALSFGERARFYEYRGNAYYHTDDYKRALADYERALEIAPTDIDILLSKASVLRALQRPADAEQVVQLAEQLSPTDPRVLKRKSFIESDAVKGYDHAVKGLELLKSGQFPEAIGELNEAIKLKPDNYVTYYNRGIAYMQLGDEEHALMDFQRTVERNSTYIGAYYNMGTILSRQKKYDEAIYNLTKVIKLNPTAADAYYARSYAYHEKGDYSSAKSDARRAADMGSLKAQALLQHLEGPGH